MDISKLIEFNDSKEFFGIYNHNQSIYRLKLKLPECPSMKSSEVDILKNLDNFTLEVQPYESTLQRKRDDILNEITLLSRQEAFDILVASDLTAIRFYDQSHYLNLSVTMDLDVVLSQHSLPDQHKWFQPGGTVTSFFNEFTKSLDQLEEFYSNVNTIDEFCYVVDPIQPSTKINYRIFKIDQKCYAKVVMDPLLPSSISVTFIGPTSLVEHYRSKYEHEVSNWDHELDVHKNLLKICGRVFFPMRNGHDETDALSCSICGMYRLGDSIPMVTCDNSKCDLLFHVGCLKQWWSMFADSKTFLAIELGTKCPMCKEKLSTSFEQLFSDREQ